MIVKNSNKWVNGTVLHYYFFDKATDGANLDGTQTWKTWKGGKKQMDVVRKAFGVWKQIGIGLEFKEVKNREEAEIRIGFMEDDGSWSYVGRDVLKQPTNDRTMNFGWDIAIGSGHNGIDTVIHEIGHTLGFPHEHQNPYAGIKWDEEAVYRTLGNPPNSWPRETTFHNIIRKISTEEVSGSRWDANSVMHYPFEPGLILEPAKYNATGIKPAGGLSKQDIKYAKVFYPPMSKSNFTEIVPMTSFDIDVKNSEQKNFQFTPTESKLYNIQTFGNLDTVIVLFEEADNKELQYVSGDDNGGTDKNAVMKVRMTRGRKYVIKARVYYKNPKEKTAIMVW